MRTLIKQLLRESIINKSKLAEENQNSCNCCKYFNMETLNNFSGLEHPLYYMLNKSEMSKVKYMSPKQYIFDIARGFGVSYDDAVSSVNNDLVKKYASDMQNGDKFPIGYYRDGETGQEGRHRALALMLLDCDSMPVVVIRKLSNEEIKKLVNYFKDKSKEQIDEEFKKMGYNGISNLDYKSLTEYIEYKL